MACRVEHIKVHVAVLYMTHVPPFHLQHVQTQSITVGQLSFDWKCSQMAQPEKILPQSIVYKHYKHKMHGKG